MPTPSKPDPSDSPEMLLAEYLARRTASSELEFEALCQAHPEQARVLRDLLEQSERAQEALRSALRAAEARARSPGSSAPPFAERLREQFGEGVDPQIALEARDREAHAVGAPAGAPTDDLLRRLKEHSLEQSRYRLEGEIARGGMGVILRVWDEDLRRHLAMKVILGRGDATGAGGTPPVDARALGRFLEEAQVTGQLDHPGIVPVHELGLDNGGRVYFTMKLVKGRDLKHVFDLVFAGREGWNETRALSVILKACEAMAYAHKKGVIHRDLKPANVMVGNFGEVYVMDWGLARVLSRKDAHDLRIAPEHGSGPVTLTAERRAEHTELSDSPIVTLDGDVVGTPSYMAPEQARGEIEKLGPRSDVYSMGAMLYHLLVRSAPYVPEGPRVSNRMVLRWVLEGPPRPLHELRPDVPAELVAIVEKAMAREASLRYADTLALAEDLRAFLEHRVVRAYGGGAWAEARKWVQRNRYLAASLATAVLLLVAGLTASLVFKSQADEKAAMALAEKANVLKLSAFQTLDDLTTEADALWPATPDLAGRYRDWMRKAEELHARLPDFRASLAELEQRALPQTEAELAQEAALAGAEPRRRRIWRFAEEPSAGETSDRWWHEQIQKLILELTSFGDEQSGLMRGVSEAHGWGVAKRLQFASEVEERTLRGEPARTLWSEASAAIAASPKYGGLQLKPQLGLVPIGADPESGLWEFALLQSGEPARRGADGQLQLEEETGLVFVLLPGGKFRMGAQKTDPAGPNYDPQTLGDESPVHSVQLSPFFLSKYEMTQGQWERFTGRNPSQYGKANLPGSSNHAGKSGSGLHPVEQVTWTTCVETLRRLGCELPTEAQWEHGCRGGSASVYWTGAEAESLRGAANLADAYAHEHGGEGWSPWEPGLDDGNTLHAEVGSYRANPFGLHDVHGNVWEWCADAYEPYPAGEQLDPQPAASGGRKRVARGGGFRSTAALARCANRDADAPENQGDNLGLRPARRVER